MTRVDKQFCIVVLVYVAAFVLGTWIGGGL